jgi:uncharacterized protein
MSTIVITREGTGDTGRYVGRIDGVAGEAELTFAGAGPGQIAADHTFAPETMRGTGIAQALVQRLVADARASATKIVPVCTYVQAQFKRHPDWADVLAPAG